MIYLVYFKDLDGGDEIPWSEKCLNGGSLKWDIQEAVNGGNPLYAIKGEGKDIEDFLSSNFLEDEYKIKYIFEI